MSRIGFVIERHVEIEGPFQGVANRDAVFAKATVTIQDREFRVAAVVSGPSRDLILKPLSALEREEALGWFALVFLAKAPSEGLKAPDPSVLTKVNLEIPLGNREGQQWTTIDDVRNYKDEQLRDFETGYERRESWSRWFARSKP